MGWDYPVFLDLTGRRCLIVGSGWPTLEKATGLLRAGADVTLLATEAAPEIERLAAEGAIRWERRDYREGDLEGFFLVLSTHEDKTRTEPLWREAAARNVLFNGFDDPPHCNFSYPAIHRRGDLGIAIGTNGKCPALAVRLRQRFKEEIGEEYGALVQMLGELRGEIVTSISDFETKKDLWYRLIDSGCLERIRQGDIDGARSELRAIFEETRDHAHAGV